MKKLNVAIIGVTGSVGRQTVDVIKRNADRFDIQLITAHSNAVSLEQIGKELGAKRTILTKNGMGELLRAVDETELDVALVAAAGTDIIAVAYKLAQKGIKLALANKECIVSAGKFVMAAIKESGGMIIPVDSEHSALFQCMCGHRKEDIAGLVLTASGGAFRDLPKEALETVSIKDALTNPNWSMGQKITVDSATMMNKGLELIEARYLFDIEPNKLSVVIHPQSIVHSMVSYKDGAVLAQLGLPDMRVPIAYALGCGEERIDSGVKQLDFTQNMALTFSPPDID
ncbi:MAG: 1-deoxy-D-xylulose-5-phosphate reductoisomerase, partial [Deferribacteraceae bacterium]|nr:1-deoxy-D-xylulose-5-phosphate reductoisomerase [Deferribacteraceae bacterium]